MSGHESVEELARWSMRRIMKTCGEHPMTHCCVGKGLEFPGAECVAEPAWVFDALGAELKMVLACNVETGEACVYARDAAGELVVDYERGEVRREWVMRPAPLRIERPVGV